MRRPIVDDAASCGRSFVMAYGSIGKGESFVAEDDRKPKVVFKSYSSANLCEI